MKASGFYLFAPFGPNGDDVLFIVTQKRKHPRLVREIIDSCGAKVTHDVKKEIFSSLMPAEYESYEETDGRRYCRIRGKGFNFKYSLDEGKVFVLKLDR